MVTTKELLNSLTYEIIGAAIEVHKYLDTGLLESVYQACIEEELKQRGVPIQSQMIIPVEYKGLQIDALLRCDLFAHERIVVELKAVEKVLPIHEAQLLTYMKLLKAPKGILLNFNSTNIFKEGQKTFVNEFYRDLPEK